MGMAMCMNATCPSAGHCYRQQREPHQYRQSYSKFTPDDTGKCDHYIEAVSKSQVNRLDATVGVESD